MKSKAARRAFRYRSVDWKKKSKYRRREYIYRYKGRIGY